MKRFAFGALAAVGCAVALVTGAVAAMPHAVPTPVALQYEEITRFAMPSQTAPPPGSFDDDRANVVAASAPGPQHHGLLGNVMNSYSSAMSAMRSLQAGTLTRYTYYRGWIRTDDVLHQTATIEKCDRHEFITLDLARHTYRISSTEPSPAPAPAPRMPGQPARPAAPGTVDLTMNAVHTNLGPRTIEGIATHGDSLAYSVTMSHATGSCSNGSMSMQVDRYVSGIGIPRAYCPLPRVSTPSNPVQYEARGGCTPRLHGSASGMGGMASESDRLAMYSAVWYAMGQANGQRMGAVTEAGNVRWLSGRDADALFEIPPGFTRESP